MCAYTHKVHQHQHATFCLDCLHAHELESLCAHRKTTPVSQNLHLPVIYGHKCQSFLVVVIVLPHFLPSLRCALGKLWVLVSVKVKFGLGKTHYCVTELFAGAAGDQIKYYFPCIQNYLNNCSEFFALFFMFLTEILTVFEAQKV